MPETAAKPTRTDRAAKGYAVNVAQTVLYMVLQGLLAPLVLKYAGVDTLGAYGAIMQVVACFAVFDNAFSVTLARYLARQHGVEASRQQFQSVFTTGRTCLLLGSAVLAVAALIASGPLVALLRLPAAMEADARRSLYVLAAWFILRVPLASYDDALIATQNMATAHTITGLQNAARVIGSLTAVLLGFGLVGMIASAIAADLAAGSLYRHFFFRIYPDRGPGWGFPDAALLKTMFAFAVHAFLIQVAALLTFNSSQLVGGYVMGAVGVSIIYTNQLPASTAQALILRLSDSASPAINELYGRGDMDAIRRAFLRVHRLTLNLAVPLAAGILLLNRSLISLWVGPKQYGGELMTAALAALSIVVAIEHVNVVFSMALGHEKTVTRFALAESICAVALSCVFGKLWGVGGIPLAVAICIVPKTAYLIRLLGRDLQGAVFTAMQYLRECFMPAAAASLTAFIAAAWLAHAAGAGTWLTAAGAGALFCAVYAGASYAICFSPDERLRMRRYLAVLAPQAG
ncbi:MAG TPA: hypothetical protein VKV17_18720 [Bryobacteraceae bacterium]|nr:hypothetical protein [Bryobacteraceae bacterium]